MNENRTTTAVAARTGTDIVFGADGKLQFNNYAAVLDFTGQLVAAGMAPKNKTKEQCAICIAFGLPLGMDVLASIQNIAVINGMPCVWGDALVGLVMASGLLEDMKTEYLPNTKDCAGVRVTVRRKGVPSPFEGMFSRKMAELAGLWGKPGPWTQYPTRMMLNRARAFALRDAFPDVLKGLKVAEEVADIPVTVDPATTHVSPAPYAAKPASAPVTAASLIDAAAKPAEPSAPSASAPDAADETPAAPEAQPEPAPAPEAAAPASEEEPF